MMLVVVVVGGVGGDCHLTSDGDFRGGGMGAYGSGGGGIGG